jgi:hypothetical protein
MPRRTLTASIAAAILAWAVSPATAQTGGPVFRIEEDTGAPHARKGVVAGWLYNEGQGVVGLVRMRVELLDSSGRVVGEHLGWAYGNVPPGGRAYFRVSVPNETQARRISVESFVLQSLQNP